MKILFLYTELADYTISCLKALKEECEECELLIIHMPINNEAPFVFDFGKIGNFICIDSFRNFQLFLDRMLSFKPDIVVCSGWINKWYVLACRMLAKKALCIVCSDNQWDGRLKQQMQSMLSPITLGRIFKKIWIPGIPQLKFARKLGYAPKDILMGFYSCDVDRFSSYYSRFRTKKELLFPHRFLCVARYVPAKGYKMLWSSFIEWKSKTNNDWELWCAGTGIGFEDRVQHPSIRHLGFVQKDEWPEIIGNTGVFILPSLFEPWGVVVQEFSAAGFPLVCSNRVGSSQTFLTRNNGVTFDPANSNELICCFQEIDKMDNIALAKMSKISNEVSYSITPRQWAQTLLTSVN